MNDQLFKQFKDQFVNIHYKVGDKAGFARGWLRRVLDTDFWQVVPSPEAEGADVIKSITLHSANIFKIEELDHGAYVAATKEDREMNELINKTQRLQAKAQAEAQARQLEKATEYGKGAKPKLDLTPPIVLPGSQPSQ